MNPTPEECCGSEKPKFGFSLTLHYLCRCAAKVGCTSGIETKNFVFCFVFRSVCTTFALSFMVLVYQRHLLAT